MGSQHKENISCVNWPKILQNQTMIEHGESTAWAGYPKLYGWRARLSSIQQSILQNTWQTFLTTGKWALLRPIYRDAGKSSVVTEISTLAGFCMEEQDYQSGNRLRLLLPGVFLTDDGLRYTKLIEAYLGFQYGLFQNESEIRSINYDEIEEKLKLSEDETKLLGHLLQIGNSISGYNQDFTNWSVRTMTDVEDFPTNENLSLQVESWITKNYYSGNPVFLEEKLRQQLMSPSVPQMNWPANPIQENAEAVPSPEGNPFQRRYQVFVSSTYNDLVEERKHVMHALLETKCIPAGMELFPAASMEQMKLIQNVIDDCDYYLVILAGKYGSCGPDGVGYTEMEFDYAVSNGKPILAFFHSDIRKLPGERLEENDEARKKLVAFTSKIKNQRLCRTWNTADGLASAVKTAVIHAIETNPKPGWVRADSVPTWKMVRNLEERIEELEGRPHSASSQNFPDGGDRIELSVKIYWEEAEEAEYRYGNPHVLSKQFLMTWDELFLHVAPTPGIKTSRNGLLRSFVHSLAKTTEDEIQALAKSQIIRLNGSVDGEIFTQILQTFLANKLLKQVPPPKHVRTKILYWQLSPKGVQKLAELRAIRVKQAG
jgi:hypothetical protein